MGERNKSNAEVERIVRFVLNDTASNEVYLRKETRTWSGDDFLYALERLGTDLSGQPVETRNQLRVLYRTLLTEREEAEGRIILESANTKRHAETSRQLEELKIPHWSIVPNFWMTLIILILTAIGTITAIILAVRH